MLPVLRWQPPAISRAMQCLFLQFTRRSLSGFNLPCPIRNSLRSDFHSTIEVNRIPSHTFGPWCGTQLACVSHSRIHVLCQYCTSSLTRARDWNQPRPASADLFHSEWNHNSSTRNRWRSGSGIAIATTLGLILCGDAKGTLL